MQTHIHKYSHANTHTYSEHSSCHLEIPVNDVLFVKVSQRQNDFRSIESRSFLSKDAFLRQMNKEFSTVDILHHKAQPIRRLKGILQMLKRKYESQFNLGPKGQIRYGQTRIFKMLNPHINANLFPIGSALIT